MGNLRFSDWADDLLKDVYKKNIFSELLDELMTLEKRCVKVDFVYISNDFYLLMCKELTVDFTLSDNTTIFGHKVKLAEFLEKDKHYNIKQCY